MADNNNDAGQGIADRVSTGVGGILKSVHGGGEVVRGEITAGANTLTGSESTAGGETAKKGLNEFTQGLNESISGPLTGKKAESAHTDS